MDTSKGIQFDFVVKGITEQAAELLLSQIADAVSQMGGEYDGGGFVSVAEFEDGPDLLDIVDDDISLDDIEEWEERGQYFCEHGENNYTCPICNNEEWE